MSTLGLGLKVTKVAGSRVNHLGLLDDQTILDELADVLTAIGIGDFIHLVRVKPDLSLTALEHRGCESLLKLKRYLREIRQISW